MLRINHQLVEAFKAATINRPIGWKPTLPPGIATTVNEASMSIEDWFEFLKAPGRYMNNMEKNDMQKLVAASKVTNVLPLLETVAIEHNLKLSNAKDFKKARTILESKYVAKIIR